MRSPAPTVVVRNTRPEDIPAIREICRRVYPDSPSWGERELSSHLQIFPEGQLVAVDGGRVVGMAASLIITWDDYETFGSWSEFTDAGMFTNHDPTGRTLYGAEVMVDPGHQRRGVGRALYAARRALCERLGLLRIRAGARIPGYHAHADQMTPETYVREVIRGAIQDPTLSFQLSEGFQVLAVVPDYLRHDPESHGYAILIEWLNPALATPADYARRARRFHAG